MPAKNRHHRAFREALEKDGWTVTHDPLTVFVGERPLFIDLGAERPAVGAIAVDLIAVEVQSFPDPSPVADLQQAIGQFAMYQAVLEDQQPDRTLYLGVETDVYNGILSEPLGARMIEVVGLKLIVFDPTERRVLRWTR